MLLKICLTKETNVTITTAAKSEIVADWREEYVIIYKGNLNLFLHNL